MKICVIGHKTVHSRDGCVEIGVEELASRMDEQDINEADDPDFKMENNLKIAKFGKFLRKTSIDELSQIWDIFVGRISIVGPRSPIYEDLSVGVSPQSIMTKYIKSNLI